MAKSKAYSGRDIKADDIIALISINPLELDKECQKQAKTYLRFALLSADAENEVRELKNKIEVLKAELANNIRNSPQDYGVPKPTVDAVAEATLLQPGYEVAIADYNKALYNYDYLKAYLRSLEHKKAMIENFISLHGMSYFAEPRGTAEAKNAVRQRQGPSRGPVPKEG